MGHTGTHQVKAQQMARLGKADLEQMGEDYFRSLASDRLVEVAKNLHELAVEQLEKLEQTSKTSSRPPSSDSPYRSSQAQQTGTGSQECPTVEASEAPVESSGDREPAETATDTSSQATQAKGFGQRKAGKQTGGQGKWRTQPLRAERTIDHYPQQCAACNAELGHESVAPKPYMGYYQYELVRHHSGFEIECQLHHYYGATCRCGHHSQARPGQGERSVVAGRHVQLHLQDYTLVGPMLGTLMASLAVRYRLSRAKIQEFLHDWAGIELSIGRIDRSIREAGLACRPVVEELVAQLQDADILHMDETPWYESGQLCWLWVVVSQMSVVFCIGQRTKAMMLDLVSSAFTGWLVSDGYGAYRWYGQRQRCLAHLIRKALALTQAVDAEARQLAQWLLEELRALIHSLTQTDGDDSPGAIHLQKVALLATASQHPQLKALANEILNDWDAVVAFVHHPHLPVTNNQAERALRHAVIARRIGYGTRTSEGSQAYAALLSVIETCRLRLINPWIYLAQVISSRRKGLAAPPIPFPLTQTD